MTVARIEEVVLYTNSAIDPIVTHELQAWMDHSGIEHIKLDYPDNALVAPVLDPLNTWWQLDDNGVKQPPLTEFPFVVYTEVHSDKPVSYIPKKYIAGKDNIIATLPAIYALGR